MGWANAVDTGEGQLPGQCGGNTIPDADGPFETICEIERETLSQIGNTSDEDEMVAIFERHRPTIERAASDKYDRTSRRDYEIITITAADLASKPCGPGFLSCDGT
jgi:Protein of unknown function (DUF1488)